MPTPAPVTWSSFNLTKNLLSFSYPTYSSDATYNILYDNASTTYTLPFTTLTNSSIYCPNIDGTPLSIYYYVNSSGSLSSFSPKVTLLCAGLPTDVQLISYTSFLNIVTLTWPSSGGNGSPVQGYLINRYNTIWTLIGNTSSTTLFFSDTIHYNVSYNYTVYAYNQVGSSVNSYNLTVNITQQANATTSNITTPTSFRVGYPSNFIVNLFDSGGNKTLNPSLMILEMRDVCAVVNGFECQRVNATDPNYVPDLMNNFAYYVMSNDNDGTMSATVTPNLIGPYSFTVFQLQPYGALCNYWDNIWFLPPLDHSALISNFNLSWNAGTLITTYSSEFVSAKYFAFLYAGFNDNYTFYVTADDNFRFYVDGVLVMDAWQAPCCQEIAFSYYLNAGYSFIQVEFRQLDGAAGLLISWSSQEFSKQLIPANNLYWPVRVSGSPWVEYAGIGLSYPQMCYFTSPLSGFSGDLATFILYSADQNGNLINNINDVFSISFSGPSNYYFVSSYSGSGMSYAYPILGISGSYNVSITLYGQNIAGSPFVFQVNPGYPNIEKTNAAELTTITEFMTVTAGEGNSMPVYLLDAFGSNCSGAEVSMTIIFINDSDFSSQIGVNNTDQSAFGYNQSGSFVNGALEFTVFVAGYYNVTLYLDDVVFYNYLMEVAPGSVFAQYSVAVYTYGYSVVAGNEYSFLLQLRDAYYNNLLINQVDSYTLTATGPETVQGTLVVENGVANATVSVITTGVYSLSLVISENPVGQLANFTVLPSALDLAISSVNVPATQVAGAQTTVSISTNDQFGNMLNGGLALTYSIVGITNLTGTIIDQGGGMYSLIFTPLLEDTYTVTIFYQGNILGIPQSITVSNSDVRGLTSAINSVTTQIAGKGLLTITSKDVGGNIVSNPVSSSFMGSQYYYGIIQGTQNQTVSAFSTDLTAYKLSLANVNATGTYSLILALMEENGLNGFYFKDNSFQGLYANFSYHNFPGASPAYYTTKDPVINLNFSYLGYPDFCSAYWQGMLMTGTSDTYTLTVQSDNKARLTLNGIVVLDSITGSSNSGSTLLTQGVYYSLLLQYINGGNNGFLRLLWSSSTISTRIIPASSLFSEVFCSACPYSFTVNPDSTTASMCQVSQYPGDADPLTRAYLKIAKNFLVTAKDKYGNQAISTTDTFSASLALGTTKVPATFSNVGPGQYKGSFTASSTPGTYTLTVSMTLSGVPSLITSIYINVLSGPTDPSKTTLLNVPTSVIAGVESGFIVVAKDSSGTQQFKGGDSVVISMVNTSAVPASQISVTDNGDGTYNVNFLVYLIGNYSTLVYMNGVLSNQTAYIPVNSSTISLSSSTITVPVPNTFGSNITSDIYIKDIYSNPISLLQPVFVYVTKETNPNFMPLKFNVSTVNLTKGHYQATALYTLANVDLSGNCSLNSSASNCSFVGELTVWSGIFDSKLLGNYYNNPSASGPVFYSERDAVINFTWPAGTLVNGINSSNISVVWQGFIRPASSKVYAMHLDAIGWGAAWIDKVMVMSNDTAMDANVTMSSTEYYILQVTFNNTAGDAFVRLEWKDSSVVVVPATVLYDMLSLTPISGALLAYNSVATATG